MQDNKIIDEGINFNKRIYLPLGTI